MKLHAVCIFAYKRKDTLERLIGSLLANSEARGTDLHIFCDGAKNDEDRAPVAVVRKYAKSVTGFKSVSVKESLINYGLAASVTRGVDDLFRIYDALIILEDDLVVSNGFLHFMNEGLQKYKDVSDVMSICGFSKVQPAWLFRKSEQTYLHGRSSSWGWATWKREWSLVDFEYLQNVRGFHKFGMYLRLFALAPDLPFMAKSQISMKINSWAVRYVEAQSRLRMVSVFPVMSLVTNVGFDDDATNCDIDSGFSSNFALGNHASHGNLPLRHSVILRLYLWIFELTSGAKRKATRSFG